MSARDARGYSAPMRAMHWTTVALLAGAFPLAWAIDEAGTTAGAAWLTMLHRSFGLGILVLTGLRLAWRQGTAIPPLPADLPPLQRLAALAAVAALYALLLLQPLLGLAGSLLHGDRVMLFGDLAVPQVLPVDKGLAHLVFAAHGWIAVALLSVIGGHVVAALHHHHVRRDHVLASMLPLAKRSLTPVEPGSARTSP